MVDDHDAIRYAMRRFLERAGFKTIAAATGGDALLAAKDAAAVVLDVNLPDINGIQVLKAIRGEIPGMPVILTSAVFVDRLHRTVGREAGAEAYLVSPIDHEELTATLDRVLGTGPSEAA